MAVPVESHHGGIQQLRTASTTARTHPLSFASVKIDTGTSSEPISPHVHCVSFTGSQIAKSRPLHVV